MENDPSALLTEFIRRMPKVELHLHLEGAIRPTTLLDLARRYAIDLPVRDVRDLPAWFRFRDFPHFVETWFLVCRCARDPTDFARITRELGEDLSAQGVRHAQVAFVPSTHTSQKGTPYDELLGWRAKVATVR